MVDDGPFTVWADLLHQVWNTYSTSTGLQWSGVEPRRENFVNTHLCYLLSPPSRIYQSYFTDSLNNKIYAYDYDDGNLTNRRLFVDAIALGMPENTFCDGLCTDSKGGVWSARFGVYF